ncbi:MAG: L-threonine 3-dehydrogenase [Metallosphaera javensis (ex Sakai et al. 2022)]|nr:MAG: L-threonine 3-dehydrogenase [Metallosphaera javensis (ex Sakai et al. 2022)]
MVNEMRALILRDGMLSLEELPTQGRYKVRAVGICGTDVAMVKGTYPPRKNPLILGHEFAVERDGELYASEINLVDWSCEYCRKGMYTHCVNRKAIGIDVDGAMREYMDLPNYLLHRDSVGLKPEELSLAEPTAAVLRMVELLNPSPSDRALVLGDGPIGIISAMILTHYGVEVELKGHNQGRLDLAEKLGILTVQNPSTYDMVVEATGTKALEEAIKHVKPMGKIALKSTHGLEASLNSTSVVVNEVQILGSRCGPFYLWDRAIRLIKELRLGRIVSTYPLTEYERAFHDVLQRKVMKAVLIP